MRLNHAVSEHDYSFEDKNLVGELSKARTEELLALMVIHLGHIEQLLTQIAEKLPEPPFVDSQVADSLKDIKQTLSHWNDHGLRIRKS